MGIADALLFFRTDGGGGDDDGMRLRRQQQLCVEEYISVGPFPRFVAMFCISFVTIAVSPTDRLVFAVHGGVC